MTAGLRARLSASFESDRGRSGVRVSTQPPLDLRGPLRTETGSDFYYLRNTTCGILAGDALDVDITACAGSDVQVASPSCLKVYSMTGCAESTVHIEAQEGSRLVWGPHPVILQRGSDYSQRLSVQLSGGVVLLCDVLVMGRLARGESRCFRRFASELQVLGPGRRLLYEERYVLRPEEDGAESLETSLAGMGALASVYALGLPEDVAGKALASLGAGMTGLAGVSALPNGAGIVARSLNASLSDSLAFCEGVLRRLRG